MIESTPMIAVLAVLVACAALAAMAIVLWRARKPAARDDLVLAELRRAQGEAAGRLEAMIGMLAKGQSQLAHTVNERLDSVSHRLGDSLEQTRQKTTENLQKLNERLAVIDSAQKNITELATQVTSLQGGLAT